MTTVDSVVQQPLPPSDRDLVDVLTALTAMAGGDFSVRLEPRSGLVGQVAERVNTVAALNERRTRELIRASQVIGREGRMTERLDEVGSEGDWSTGAAAINSLIDDLVRPTTEVARVIAAVAEGDLDLDGRVAARVENLSRADGLDTCHCRSSG